MYPLAASSLSLWGEGTHRAVDRVCVDEVRQDGVDNSWVGGRVVQRRQTAAVPPHPPTHTLGLIG